MSGRYSGEEEDNYEPPSKQDKKSGAGIVFVWSQYHGSKIKSVIVS